MGHRNNLSARNIHLALDADQEKWDAYVSSNSNASPYHLFAWNKAVGKGYGHGGYYLMAENADGTCLFFTKRFCSDRLYKKR